LSLVFCWLVDCYSYNYEYVMKTITFPLPPTTNHTYGQTGHRRFMYKEAKDWMETAILVLKIHRGDNPTEVTVTYYLKRDRDVEGSHKLMFDSMTKAGVIVDDKYILDVHLHKRINKENPRMVVEWESSK